MATVKKAAKSAKKAPQPVKKAPAKKAPAKPVAKAAKKAAPAKVAPKKAAPKKAVPVKAVAKSSSVKAVSAKSPVAAKGAGGKSAPKAAVKHVEAPKKGTPPAKAVVAAKKSLAPVATKSAAPLKSAQAPSKATAGKPSASTGGPTKPGVSFSKPVTGAKPGTIPVKPGSAASKTASAPAAKPAPVVSRPIVPVKVEPKSTTIARPVPKPETKLVELKPIKTSVATTVKYEPDFTKSVLDDPGHTILNAPTMRYSDVELAEFRDLIMRKLEAAKKELTYLQGLITRKDEMGGDESENRYMTMEDGSISMEREQLSQMASRQIQFIDHLEKALMRIENKTYGICRVTGKLIDKARLRAVPHATLSIEAKMGLVKKPENQNVQ
jgi:RNA polymerase-binding transcription factor DksA